ncbi:phosphohydrolase [Entomohabitans teleogrylli]|uniref:phosphohydrolase n=1 Tax=Entomohabitans teleogrylli TaxID=1384589 RepID=UPI00073D9BEE|nr:phosphohydrolase [Entomohabitans teleogrylli]
MDNWPVRFENYLQSQISQCDKAHDAGHARRVWHTAQQIMSDMPAHPLVVVAACFFHDVVNLPKNHPQRHRASSLAAEKTITILRDHFPDYPAQHYDAVFHAIEAHSFSAGIVPRTPEACIVQDADRLESLGAIGLARMLFVAASLGCDIFEGGDPLALHRELDDKRYALDHFQTKLFTLPQTMRTAAGKRLAMHNANYMVHFLAKISAELQGEPMNPDPRVLERFLFSPGRPEAD